MTPDCAVEQPPSLSEGYENDSVSTLQDRLTALLAQTAESEQLMRATVDGMLEPHLLVEAVRDEEGRLSDLRVLVANRATLEYWGMSRQQVLGASLMDMLPGHSSSGLLDVYSEVLDTGTDVKLNDFAYHNEILGEMRFYDLGASRAPGGRLSLSWRDVTERHRDVRTAAELRRHYQLLAENASDVVFRGDFEGRLMWVSPSVKNVLGWEPHLLIGRRLTDLSHPLDRERMRDALTSLAKNDSEHVEVRLKKTDRGHRWMSVTLRTALDEGEWSSATFGTFRDIESEMAVRRSLSEEKARFDAINESSTDAIISIGRTGLIVAWNRAAACMTGYAAAEALGQPYTLLVPPRFHDVVKRWLSDLSSPEVLAATTRTHNARLTRRDGSEFPCEYSVAVWNRDGQQHMTAILRDITEQRAVMDDLQDSRLELAEAQRLAGAGSWTYDPGTEELHWSDELLSIYGLPAGAVGLGLEDLIGPLSNGAEIVEAASSVIIAGRTTDTQCDLTRPDGQKRRLQARVAPVLDGNGEISRVRGTAVDVTELHLAAEARARRAARHADYLTRMEHTLRTHLSVVEGWAGILEASFDELDQATRVNAIGAIKRNSTALVGHFSGLMSEAARHAMVDDIVAEPLDVADVAARAAADYRGLSGRHVVVEPSSGVWALGSREAVDTVVRHLVENAVRHTEDVGCVEVVTRQGPASAIELVVRDDGPGIADGVQLFTPFSKESRSAGHGLGLHVVRTLVEAMGGTVEARNRTDGAGAEFIVTLRGLVT